MARGRLISKSLGSSRKFHAALQAGGTLGEFCQVLFPLIVTNTDDWGRMPGDAFTVKHVVLPSSLRLERDFDHALDILANVGLIERYCVEGAVYLQVNQFDEHQPNLHKRSTSKFPEIPGISRNSGKMAEIPGTPGNSEKYRPNLTEPNLTEPNRTERNPEPAPSAEGLVPAPALERADSPGKECRASRIPTREAFEHYHTKFLERYGLKPEYESDPGSRNKSAGNMARLLKKHGLDEVTRRLDAYFAAPDPYLQQSGHSLGLFFSSDVQTKLVAHLSGRGGPVVSDAAAQSLAARERLLARVARSGA